MTKEHATWRENEIKRVGGKMQREAEATLDKHDAEPRVDVCDDKSGCYASVKRDVANVLMDRKHLSRRRSYFSVGIEFDEEGDVVHA